MRSLLCGLSSSTYNVTRADRESEAGRTSFSLACLGAFWRHDTAFRLLASQPITASAGDRSCYPANQKKWTEPTGLFLLKGSRIQSDGLLSDGGRYWVHRAADEVRRAAWSLRVSPEGGRQLRDERATFIPSPQKPCREEGDMQWRIIHYCIRTPARPG